MLGSDSAGMTCEARLKARVLHNILKNCILSASVLFAATGCAGGEVNDDNLPDAPGAGGTFATGGTFSSGGRISPSAGMSTGS
ncbi:MAG TPA: hypothetical protein VGC79_05230, partial [Polyangiaceae bacterium]